MGQEGQKQFGEFHTRRIAEDEPELKELVVDGGPSKWVHYNYQLWCGDLLLGEIGTNLAFQGRLGGHKHVPTVEGLTALRDYTIEATNNYRDFKYALQSIADNHGGGSQADLMTTARVALDRNKGADIEHEKQTT